MMGDAANFPIIDQHDNVKEARGANEPGGESSRNKTAKGRKSHISKPNPEDNPDHVFLLRNFR